MKVHTALEKLADTNEGDVVRLQDVSPPEWRLRVGEVRVRFAFGYEDEAIVVLRVLPRGKAYDR